MRAVDEGGLAKFAPSAGGSPLRLWDWDWVCRPSGSDLSTSFTPDCLLYLCWTGSVDLRSRGPRVAIEARCGGWPSFLCGPSAWASSTAVVAQAVFVEVVSSQQQPESDLFACSFLGITVPPGKEEVYFGWPWCAVGWFDFIQSRKHTLAEFLVISRG